MARLRAGGEPQGKALPEAAARAPGSNKEHGRETLARAVCAVSLCMLHHGSVRVLQDGQYCWKYLELGKERATSPELDLVLDDVVPEMVKKEGDVYYPRVEPEQIGLAIITMFMSGWVKAEGGGVFSPTDQLRRHSEEGWRKTLQEDGPRVLAEILREAAVRSVSN